ncbi:MAG: hypothetical protein ACREXY_25900 [Gammaproteobacteria bacterium]
MRLTDADIVSSQTNRPHFNLRVSHQRSQLAVEYATLEWVDWFNHRRLLEPIGDMPPVEFEAGYHQKEGHSYIAGLQTESLR